MRSVARSQKASALTGFARWSMNRKKSIWLQRKRVSRSWFSESLGWLPVQIEQTEKNGDTVTLKLVAIRSD